MTEQNGKLFALLALIVLGALYLGEIHGYPLQDPDEGRYAEIPREMIASGDWITPKLNYVVYFEKPPLLYWLVALSFNAFGLSDTAARVVPAVAGILTVVLTFLLGQHLLGRRAALLSAGILATSPIFFVLAQALTIDVVLTFFMTATMASFYRAHLADKKRGWVALVAVSAALGVLAKGPVALVLPGLVALVFLLWRRDWATLGALVRPLPIALFALIVVPWFVAVAQANPDFLHFFFVREHLERFTANVGHPEGPFFYIPVLLLGPLPWTAVAIGLACTREGRRAFTEIPREARSYLLLWSGLIIAFFTLASSKLATYILPALPPLALVAGSWLDRALEREDLAAGLTRWLGTVMFVLGLVALSAVMIAWPLESTLAQWFGGDPEDVRAIVGGDGTHGGCVWRAGIPGRAVEAADELRGGDRLGVARVGGRPRGVRCLAGAGGGEDVGAARKRDQRRVPRGRPGRPVPKAVAGNAVLHRPAHWHDSELRRGLARGLDRSRSGPALLGGPRSARGRVGLGAACLRPDEPRAGARGGPLRGH